jgi:hypothetical protein
MDGMEVPTVLAERFKFAKQRSKLTGMIPGSFFLTPPASQADAVDCVRQETPS